VIPFAGAEADHIRAIFIEMHNVSVVSMSCHDFPYQKGWQAYYSDKDGRDHMSPKDYPTWRAAVDALMEGKDS
jgi:hypothetical protein